MRVTHLIRPNAANSVPARRLYLDTEAAVERRPGGVEHQTLAFGWACFERSAGPRDPERVWERWRRFTTPGEFWDFIDELLPPQTTLHVYAHNWDYDAALIALESESAAHGWETTQYARATHTLFIRLRRGRQHLVLVDTLNYYQMSVALLGEAVGVAKLPMPHAGASPDVWDAYCRADIAVLRAAMHAYFRLVREGGLGKCALTVPAQAFHAWRHRHMHVPVLVLAAPDVSALERSAYHGGRTEVFYDRPLPGPVYALDVNGMYPSVMSTEPMPHFKMGKGHALPVARLSELLEKRAVIATALVRASEPCYPVVRSGRLIFPTGTFETTLASPELRLALERGEVLAVGPWVAYRRALLFQSYVEQFYALRRRYEAEGNLAMALVAKLLLNGLYGKFGQSGRRWELCRAGYEPPVRDFYARCPGAPYALLHHVRLGQVLHNVREGESAESFPAIAAHITSAARVKLWRYFELAGRENVYYCDTDSLYVSDTGLSRLRGELDPHALGSLKIEGQAPSAHFRAPKDYDFGQASKVKGIRVRARLIEPGVYEQEQFASYDTMLAAGVEGAIDVTTVRKRLRRDARGSDATAGGWRRPFVLREDRAGGR